MPKLPVDISDELYTLLKSTFLDDDISIAGFALSALKEYAAWLGGQDRPSTMSELETKRIYFVYENILTDRVPTIWEIGEYFNLPLGRSRYIVQNLNYRYPIFMQQRKVDVLISALQKYQKKNGLQSIKCPKECSDLMETAISELKLANALNATPSRHSYTYDTVYEMGNQDREKILQYIESNNKKGDSDG